MGIGAKEICTAFSVVMTMDLSWQIAKAGDKLYHIWLLKSCFPMSLDISSMNKTPDLKPPMIKYLQSKKHRYLPRI